MTKKQVPNYSVKAKYLCFPICKMSIIFHKFFKDLMKSYMCSHIDLEFQVQENGPICICLWWYLEKEMAPQLQYSCLENPMDGGAWLAAVHGVAEGRTRLSDFTFTFHFHALEKEMKTHSSGLAWRIPGTGEPGGLHRVGHNWSDLAAWWYL